MGKHGTINQSKCLFFCCDCQEGYRTKIKDFDQYILSAQMLVRTAIQLEIPLLVTEENPQQNGKIANEIQRYIHGRVYQKLSYSMINDETQQFINFYPGQNIAIVFGFEAHISVLQTVQDLLKQNFIVYVIIDAVDSSRKIDRIGAHYKMKDLGVKFTTVESLIYQFLRSFGSTHMKNMAQILKTERKFPYSKL